MEKEITMEELSARMGKIEKVLTQLSEKFKLEETKEETTSKEETTEEKSKEEAADGKTKEVKASKETTKETSTKETKGEESTKEEETKSSKVGKTAKEEEAEETTKEETKTEETEEEETDEEKEAEADKVALAEAEGVFEKLLQAGKVVPAQKDLLIPLLTSNEKVELSDGKSTTTKAQLIEYLEKQEAKVPLSEKGTTSTSKGKTEKKIEMTEEVKRQTDKIADAFEFSDEEKGEFIKEVAEEKGGQ